MSLDWDISNISGYKNLCYYDAPCDMPEYDIKQGDIMLSPKTNGLIWATALTGMPQITNNNWHQFYVRLKAYEHVGGPMLHEPGGKPFYYDPETVRAHIGLSTNAKRSTPKLFEDFLCGLAAENQRTRDNALTPVTSNT